MCLIHCNCRDFYVDNAISGKSDGQFYRWVQLFMIEKSFDMI